MRSAPPREAARAAPTMPTVSPGTASSATGMPTTGTSATTWVPNR